MGDGEKLLTYLNSALKALLGFDIFPRVPKKSEILLPSVIRHYVTEIYRFLDLLLKSLFLVIKGEFTKLLSQQNCYCRRRAPAQICGDCDDLSG